MKLRPLFVAAMVLIGSAVCARLGLWQLERWHEKQALNARLRAAESLPPIRAERAPSLAQVRGRYVELSGRYDALHQIAIGGHLRDEVPGIEIVTPLILGDGSAVLVDRGWIAVDQAGPVDLGPYDEPGTHTVIGYPESLRAGRQAPTLTTRSAGSRTVFWGRELDLDTLAARLPYPIASYALRQAPGASVPSKPARSRPEPLDEGMHLGYAIQWFSFGIILLGGSAWLAWQRKRAAAAKTAPISRAPSRQG